MQLETIAPVDASFASSGSCLKDLVRVNPAVMTDLKRCGVDKGDAGTLPLPCLQIAAKRNHCRSHQLDKAVVGNQVGKFSRQMLQDMLRIVALEVTVRGGVKQHNQRHNLGYS